MIKGLFVDLRAVICAISSSVNSKPHPETETPEKTCRGTVEFRNVTFAYPNADEAVIKGVSFVSKPGETTAIIGRTGCGKSSISKLIPRLYDTQFA